MADWQRVAAQLSPQQEAYLLAVAKAEQPYEPRHGRTANWALRHRYVVMLWRRAEDGKAVPWMHLSSDTHSAEALGCALTEDGAEIAAAIEWARKQKDERHG